MKAAQLPADLRAAMDSVFVDVRVDAVRELERWLHGRGPGRRLAAEQTMSINAIDAGTANGRHPSASPGLAPAKRHPWRPESDRAHRCRRAWRRPRSRSEPASLPPWPLGKAAAPSPTLHAALVESSKEASRRRAHPPSQ